MKRVVWLASLFALTIPVLAYCVGFGGADGQAAAAPPLSLEGYLDEKLPEAPKTGKAQLAKNTACYVCHGNYDGEPLVAAHAEFEIGCVDCHGESVEHRNDEDNITPPDRMYPQEDIDSSCSVVCHKTHEAPASKVIGRWQKRCPAKTNPEEIVCTDCHFKHRLPFRTVWWNKKTGELVVRKGGQRVKQADDYTKQPAAGPK